MTRMAELMDSDECSGKRKPGRWETRRSGEEAYGWSSRSEQSVKISVSHGGTQQGAFTVVHGRGGEEPDRMTPSVDTSQPVFSCPCLHPPSAGTTVAMVAEMPATCEPIDRTSFTKVI